MKKARPTASVSINPASDTGHSTSSDAEVAVRLSGVSRTYRDGGLGGRKVPVLNGVDLEVFTGETLAIVGPSGSGKSTLLNLLGALDLPDQGKVEVLGNDLACLDDDGLAQLRGAAIGFVFQFHQLLPDFTILENVEMPGRIAGGSSSDLRRRAAHLLEEVGLAERGDFFPAELSGGERQRVAICRALFNRPALLLADEPTGNLDAVSGATILDLFLGLSARHQMTAIVVTHNMAVASRCQRVVRLESGALEAQARG